MKDLGEFNYFLSIKFSIKQRGQSYIIKSNKIYDFKLNKSGIDNTKSNTTSMKKKTFYQTSI